MSRSKAFLILLFFLGGAAALWLGRREVSRDETDPSLRAMRELGALQMAIEKFRMDTGTYPQGREGLGALLHRPYTLTSQVWHGPYMDSTVGNLRDPWGRSYGYQDGEDGRGRAVSLGADGRPGGSGPDQDLYGAPLAGTASVSPPSR